MLHQHNQQQDYSGSSSAMHSYRGADPAGAARGPGAAPAAGPEYWVPPPLSNGSGPGAGPLPSMMDPSMSMSLPFSAAGSSASARMPGIYPPQAMPPIPLTAPPLPHLPPAPFAPSSSSQAAAGPSAYGTTQSSNGRVHNSPRNSIDVGAAAAAAGSRAPLHAPSTEAASHSTTSTTTATASYKPTLRRNQACLQCRRRKLRCDAAKPVCKTCIRSHAHAVRTGSVPDPRLECTYEDGPQGGHGSAASTNGSSSAAGKRRASSNAGGHASDDGGGDANSSSARQPRKNARASDHSNGDGSSKRRKGNGDGSTMGAANGAATGHDSHELLGPTGEGSEEVARLQGKIAWLETQLASNPPAIDDPPGGSSNWIYGPSTSGVGGGGTVAHDTHLLDMLSAAAATSSSSSSAANADGSSSWRPELTTSAAATVEDEPSADRLAAPSVPSASTYLPPSAQRRARPGEHSIHEIGIGAGWGSTAANHIPYEIIAPVPRSTIAAAQDSMMPTVTEQRRKEQEQPRAPVEPDKVLLDILYPGWPVDLPDPALMEHLIDCFFQFVPSVNRIFVYDSFKTRMTLPPSSDNFPDEAILHAICATSARYTARVHTVDSRGEPWKQAPRYHENPALEPDFGIRHSLFAKKVIDRNLAAGVRIYESAQALACLSNHYHSYARWVEGWVGIGMLNRIVVPLGLTNDTMICGPGGDGKASLIGPARSDVEREERRALLWTAIIYDVQTATASGWSGGIQIDEITTPLPASLAAIESGLEVPPNEQTAHSLDLFTRHPVIDGFTMHVKAHILLHRVSKFCRLWKATQYAQAPNVDGRAMKEFKDLDGMIGTFVLTFPPALRDPLAPLKGRVYRPFDIDLFGAQVLLHQMAILLHEPFADLDDPDDMSTRRLISSARGILKMIYLVTSTSLDLCLLVRYQLGFWTAARTLVLFLKYSIDTGNTPGGPVETLRSEIEVFRLTFQAQATRFPISARHVTMLETLVDACAESGPACDAQIARQNGATNEYGGAGYSGAGDVTAQASSLSPARSAAMESPGGDNGSVSGFSASNWSVSSTLPLSQLLDKKRGFVASGATGGGRSHGGVAANGVGNVSGEWSTRSQGSSAAMAPDGDRFTP